MDFRPSAVFLRGSISGLMGMGDRWQVYKVYFIDKGCYLAKYFFRKCAEVFNVTNTPHFANPEANASNPSSFGIITNTANSGREGIDERFVRLGLRLGF